jgi:uncharacterized membrane protein
MKFMKRITSIDTVRGMVMMIMALDHVRDLMHIHSISQSPTDLTTTTPLLFFTRWITYLCAPIFVFLAGSSAYLTFKRKNNLSESREFLLKRGLWLMFLEFTVVNFGLYFDIGFHTLLFEVIATIGFGFIILGLSLKLSIRQIGIIGLVIVFGHNLITQLPLPPTSFLKTLLTPLFNPIAIPLFSDQVFVMGYPPIPWLGILLIGFASGHLFEMEEKKKERLFLKIGVTALVSFVILRFVNSFGDPVSWLSQKNSMLTFLSFMNVTKYPPSLLFSLVTLGAMFMLLAFTDHFNSHFNRIASVYGKVPLFYFIVHFYLIHLVTLAVLLLQGFQWSQFEFATGTFGRPKVGASGLELMPIYLIWVGVVLALYKPCLWYGKYKTEHRKWWLRYI